MKIVYSEDVFSGFAHYSGRGDDKMGWRSRVELAAGPMRPARGDHAPPCATNAGAGWSLGATSGEEGLEGLSR